MLIIFAYIYFTKVLSPLSESVCFCSPFPVCYNNNITNGFTKDNWGLGGVNTDAYRSLTQRFWKFNVIAFCLIAYSSPPRSLHNSSLHLSAFSWKTVPLQGMQMEIMLQCKIDIHTIYSTQYNWRISRGKTIKRMWRLNNTKLQCRLKFRQLNL